MNSINSFSAWEKNTVAKITKLAKESNYTLGQCSFVPRTYPLSEHLQGNRVQKVAEVIRILKNGDLP